MSPQTCRCWSMRCRWAASLSGPRQPTCWAFRQLALTWAAVAAAACRLAGTRFGLATCMLWRSLLYQDTMPPLHCSATNQLSLPLFPAAQQCAEACRAAFPDEDFMHLAGLLAPLGKLLAHAK